MRSIRRADIPSDPLPGRAVRRIVGCGAVEDLADSRVVDAAET